MTIPSSSSQGRVEFWYDPDERVFIQSDTEKQISCLESIWGAIKNFSCCTQHVRYHKDKVFNQTLLPPRLPSKEIRNPIELANDDLKKIKKSLLEAKKFQSTWTMKSYKPFFPKKTALEALAQELQSGNKENWNQLKKRVKGIAEKAYLFTKEGKPILWVTGTNSCTFIGMGQMVKKGLCSAPALWPTGRLIKKNIAPLAGELGDGIKTGGINHKCLSGVEFERSFEEAYDYAKYADKVCDLSDELNFIIECKIKKNLLRTLLRLKISVLRIVHFGNEEQKQEAEQILRSILLNSSEEERQKLAPVGDLFKNEASYSVSETEKLLRDRCFPIVFGTTQDLEGFYKPVRSDIRGERAVAKTLALGSEIDVIFTKSKCIDFVKTWLKLYNLDESVTVMSFRTARFIAYSGGTAASRKHRAIQ